MSESTNWERYALAALRHVKNGGRRVKAEQDGEATEEWRALTFREQFADAIQYADQLCDAEAEYMAKGAAGETEEASG